MKTGDIDTTGEFKTGNERRRHIENEHHKDAQISRYMHKTHESAEILGRGKPYGYKLE